MIFQDKYLSFSKVHFQIKKYDSIKKEANMPIAYKKF
jgi:hypothetical protein